MPASAYPPAVESAREALRAALEDVPPGYWGCSDPRPPNMSVRCGCCPWCAVDRGFTAARTLLDALAAPAPAREGDAVDGEALAWEVDEEGRVQKVRLTDCVELAVWKSEGIEWEWGLYVADESVGAAALVTWGNEMRADLARHAAAEAAARLASDILAALAAGPPARDGAPAGLSPDAERAWWAGHDAGYRAGLEARDHTAAMAVMAAREEKPA